MTTTTKMTKNETHAVWIATLIATLPADWPGIITAVRAADGAQRANGDWTSSDERVVLTARHRSYGSAEAFLATDHWHVSTDNFPATILAEAALAAANKPDPADVTNTVDHIAQLSAASGWTVEDHGDTLLRERCWTSPDGRYSIAWCPDHSGDPDSWFVNRPGLHDEPVQAVSDEHTPAAVLLALAAPANP